MQPLPVGETGVATARASAGEGDHPICTEWSEAERRKIGDTPALGDANPCRREGRALSSLRWRGPYRKAKPGEAWQATSAPACGAIVLDE